MTVPAETRQRCRNCGAEFNGTRSDARRARWEPYSHSSQAATDSGPMVCPSCVTAALDSLLTALRQTCGQELNEDGTLWCGRTRGHSGDCNGITVTL